MYDKACYRSTVITEFERFLPEVLAVTNGDYRYLSLAYVAKLNDNSFQFDNERISTNDNPWNKLTIFLMELGEMYLAEYKYSQTKTIIEWARKQQCRDLVGYLGPQYFRRTNTYDEGKAFFAQCLREFPGNCRLFEEAIGLMDIWSKLKPYQPRPRRKESIQGPTIKLAENRAGN